MSNKHEVFISVDVETAGPIPGEYSLLSIGACLVDDENKTFECQLQPVNYNADPKALEVTGLSLELLSKNGLPPEKAMLQFSDWITGLSNGESDFVFVGFNAAFDWSFINYYFHKYLGKNPFGFTALDIKSYYMGLVNCDWKDTKSSKVAKKINPQRHGDHDALHDALYQAEIFRMLRKGDFHGQ